MKRLNPHFYKDRQGLWRWRFYAARGGNILAESGEGYTRKASAVAGFRSLARAIIDRFEQAEL